MSMIKAEVLIIWDMTHFWGDFETAEQNAPQELFLVCC